MTSGRKVINQLVNVVFVTSKHVGWLWLNRCGKSLDMGEYTVDVVRYEYRGRRI